MSMKFAALLALPLLSLSGAAQEAPAHLELGGVPALLAEKVKEAKAAAIVNLDGRVGGGGYLPIWTFQNADGSRQYLELPNLGWRSVQGQKPSGMVSAAVNLPAISAALWDFDWAKKHVKRSPFPPIFLGPTVLLPLDVPQLRSLKIKNWREFVGVTLSVRLSK